MLFGADQIAFNRGARLRAAVKRSNSTLDNSTMMVELAAEGRASTRRAQQRGPKEATKSKGDFISARAGGEP